jgi:hypothetical protein
LEYRSKPCIFLGYHHAGYKCLDPVTNKVYLSRHVVFNEDSFPAKDQTVSLLPSKVCAQNDAPFILPVRFPVINIPHAQSSSISAASTPAAQPSAEPYPPSPLADTATPSTPQPGTTPRLSPNHISVSSPPVNPLLAPTPSPAPLQPSSSTPLQPCSSSHHISNLASDLVPPHPPHSMVTRSRTGSRHPKSFPDFHLYLSQ